MKTIGRVLLYVKLLVALKHPSVVCKVAALLQTLLGCLRTLLQASAASGDHFFCQSFAKATFFLPKVC